MYRPPKLFNDAAHSSSSRHTRSAQRLCIRISSDSGILQGHRTPSKLDSKYDSSDGVQRSMRDRVADVNISLKELDGTPEHPITHRAARRVHVHILRVGMAWVPRGERRDAIRLEPESLQRGSVLRTCERTRDGVACGSSRVRALSRADDGNRDPLTNHTSADSHETGLARLLHHGRSVQSGRHRSRREASLHHFSSTVARNPVSRPPGTVTQLEQTIPPVARRGVQHPKRILANASNTEQGFILRRRRHAGYRRRHAANIVERGSHWMGPHGQDKKGKGTIIYGDLQVVAIQVGPQNVIPAGSSAPSMAFDGKALCRVGLL
ncbi:hypothetical protein HD554DRAFT_2035038 [Boletus coccyginus]|nr:hypothetical protein HD554DRAFT_2035038 [Boletus coccyginus]